MSLESLFTPQSIAVVGASTRSGAVGNDILRNLLTHGYEGRVFPVNPKAETLMGLTCYPALSALPIKVDLAIIVIPAPAVPDVLVEVSQAGIQQAIIISAGFREVGREGEKREAEIKRIAEEHQITLLGPNCLGYLHPKLGLNASFAKQMPRPGNISFFSQSGALATGLLDMTSRSLGFSHFVSVGNKALLKETDFLEYFADEKDTKVIAFYTESLADAPTLIQKSRAILGHKEPKPILALKSGTTEAGTRASSSHTGSLAGSDAAYSALFRQARILRAKNFPALLDNLFILSKNALPKGNRVGIITNAGGLGVLASDALTQAGLSVPAPDKAIQEKLRSLLPPAASAGNPIDVLGDAGPDRYQGALELLGKDENIDMILLIITPQSMTQGTAIAEVIANFRKKNELPLAAVFAGEDSFGEAISVLEKSDIAAYRFPEAAAEALGALSQVALWHREKKPTSFRFKDIDKNKARAIIRHAEKEERTQLSPSEVQCLLTAYGIPFPKSAVAKTRAEAEKIATHFKQPFVLKVVSPDIIHKSDVGGVILGVTKKTLEASMDRLMANVAKKAPQAEIEGVYLGEMAPEGGKELILGIKDEPGLGKLIMVGLGGIYVEVFRDASFRFAPLAKEDTQEMLHELKSGMLLRGARGEAVIDEKAIEETLGRLSALATDFPEIQELDINPLLVFPEAKENLALDARVTLSFRSEL